MGWLRRSADHLPGQSSVEEYGLACEAVRVMEPSPGFCQRRLFGVHTYLGPFMQKPSHLRSHAGHETVCIHSSMQACTNDFQMRYVQVVSISQLLHRHLQLGTVSGLITRQPLQELCSKVILVFAWPSEHTRPLYARNARRGLGGHTWKH